MDNDKKNQQYLIPHFQWSIKSMFLNVGKQLRRDAASYTATYKIRITALHAASYIATYKIRITALQSLKQRKL